LYKKINMLLSLFNYLKKKKKYQFTGISLIFYQSSVKSQLCVNRTSVIKYNYLNKMSIKMYFENSQLNKI